MPPSLTELLNFTTPIAAVLLAVSSLFHCGLMCGPIAAAAMNPTKPALPQKQTRNWRFLQYQLGRSASYTFAGFAAATAGHVLRPSPIAVALFLVLVLALVIVQLFQITIPNFMKVSTGPLYGRLMTGLRRLGPFGKLPPFGLGLLTPLIPCGQLWMVLGFAALATTAPEGAALAFGFSIFSAPGVYGFSFLKQLLLKLSLHQPQLVKVGLRSALVFILALSAVKYSSLISHASQAEAKSPSPTNLICH